MKAVHKKRLAKVLAGVLCVMLMLAGCGAKAEQEETSAYEEPTWATAPEETKGVEVQTAYFTFEYPKEWENKVEEVRTEDGNNTTITFRTIISDKEVELFSIILGPEGADGYLLGQLKEDNNVYNVYSVVNDMGPEGWSEEEYNEICSLQERISEIIVQFHEDERFVPNR